MLWEEKLSEIAKDALTPGFKIHDLKVSYHNREAKIMIVLDNLNDPYGSPRVEDCETFARLLKLKLIELDEIEDCPQNYAIEVSSPGAEREVKVPDDLERFKKQPMRVAYNKEGKREERILSYIDIQGEQIYWVTADVKKNRKNKTAMKIKKEDYKISIPDVIKVNLHLDF